jgi:hypothetical protein
MSRARQSANAFLERTTEGERLWIDAASVKVRRTMQSGRGLRNRQPPRVMGAVRTVAWHVRNMTRALRG